MACVRRRVDGVLPAARGRDVVGLVDDQEVEAARERGLPLGWQRLAEEAQRPLALEEVDRGDEPREVRPRVHVEPALGGAARFMSLAVDDAELEAELVAHLVAPLELEPRGADHEHAARAVAQDELLDDEAGLDGLAEARRRRR
jgi:hypothetical protein